jgi:hypothetical protein
MGNVETGSAVEGVKEELEEFFCVDKEFAVFFNAVPDLVVEVGNEDLQEVYDGGPVLFGGERPIFNVVWGVGEADEDEVGDSKFLKVFNGQSRHPFLSAAVQDGGEEEVAEGGPVEKAG